MIRISLDETSPPTQAQGGIYLENHLQAPDVYTVLDSMYWLLTLSGRDEERWDALTERLRTQRYDK